jgi:hypothetical protein
VNRDEREHHESREHTQSPLAERRVQSHGIQNLRQPQFGATCAAKANYDYFLVAPGLRLAEAT